MGIGMGNGDGKAVRSCVSVVMYLRTLCFKRKRKKTVSYRNKINR